MALPHLFIYLTFKFARLGFLKKMSKEELLNKYRNSVNDLRKSAKDLSLSDEQVDEIFESVFVELRRQNNAGARTKLQKYSFFAVKSSAFLLLVLFVAYVLLNVHQTTSSIVLRNVQGLIYPGLKLLRFLSVPIIKRFPSLTYLYDESCLVENPYFYVSDMECWPCEHVHSIINLTGFSNHSLYQSGIPYIVKTQQNYVSFETIRQLYVDNKDVFDGESNSIKSNNPAVRNVQDLLNFNPQSTKSSNTHIVWRINRMAPARIIRSIFPRPYIVSEWSGQSIERYLMIDEPNAVGYSLPNPECSYVFVIQGSGERTIILKPSRECTRNCKTVSIILKPHYVLWYNWWYWRPISLPVENSTETSITYISSYC